MTNKSAAQKIQSVEDVRLLARRRLPASIYQMFEAGSGSNLTAIRNEEAFRDIMFRPRNGVFYPAPDISTTVLGHKISMPAIVSSVGFRTQITEGLAFLGAPSLNELDPSFLDYPANWPKR